LMLRMWMGCFLSIVLGRGRIVLTYFWEFL
jgi:hypothetical protein